MPSPDVRRLILASAGGLLASLTSSGCSSCGATSTPSGPAITVTRTVLESPRRGARNGLDANGLSGLTANDDGSLFAVSEDGAVLVEIRAGEVIAVRPIEGVDRWLDLESIAWLGGERFAIGTESEDPDRTTDRILIVEQDGERVRVTEEVLLSYSDLGAVPAPNEGIEGLCRAGETWVLSLEHIIESDGVRYAPIGVRAADGAWHARRLRLTTTIGKISGLECRATADGIEVFAIERDLETSILGDAWVARILRFTLRGEEVEITPEIVADLNGRLADHPNPEGLALSGEVLEVVTDNHYGVRTGPSELLEITRTSSPRRGANHSM